jgi:hypothetical protein
MKSKEIKCIFNFIIAFTVFIIIILVQKKEKFILNDKKDFELNFTSPLKENKSLFNEKTGKYAVISTTFDGKYTFNDVE